jgi:hypothetical protein
MRLRHLEMSLYIRGAFCEPFLSPSRQWFVLLHAEARHDPSLPYTISELNFRRWDDPVLPILRRVREARAVAQK